MSGRCARTTSRSYHGHGDQGHGGQGQSCNVAQNTQLGHGNLPVPHGGHGMCAQDDRGHPASI